MTFFNIIKSIAHKKRAPMRNMPKNDALDVVAHPEGIRIDGLNKRKYEKIFV